MLDAHSSYWVGRHWRPQLLNGIPPGYSGDARQMYAHHSSDLMSTPTNLLPTPNFGGKSADVRWIKTHHYNWKYVGRLPKNTKNTAEHRAIVVRCTTWLLAFGRILYDFRQCDSSISLDILTTGTTRMSIICNAHLILTERIVYFIICQRLILLLSV